MLARIESAFRAREASEARRRRRFAADASHELRTPLAPSAGSPSCTGRARSRPRTAATMRRIEDEATRMGGLVEDLLVLARMDDGPREGASPWTWRYSPGTPCTTCGASIRTGPSGWTGLRPGSGPAPGVVLGDEEGCARW